MFIMTRIQLVDEKSLPLPLLHWNTYHDDNHVLQMTIATIQLNQINTRLKEELNQKDTRIVYEEKKRKNQQT